MENYVTEGYVLHREVLDAGHVSSTFAFNKLMSSFCKRIDYAKVCFSSYYDCKELFS